MPEAQADSYHGATNRSARTGSSWHIAPADLAARNRLIKELAGVPKAALRHAFGKSLGGQIWAQTRATNPAPRASAGDAAPPAFQRKSEAAGAIKDEDLVIAMIESVSRRAAETLKRHQRQARAVALELTYADGSVRVERSDLPRVSADSGPMATAAIRLYRGVEAGDSPLVSINLTTATVRCDIPQESVAPVGCGLVASHA